MAFTLRRRRHQTRIELTPLLDVIFLLLTFFIYSQVMVVRAEVLPVKLAQVSGGESAPIPSMFAITIDVQGQVYLNRKPLTEAQLGAQLEKAMNTDEPPRVYLAMEAGESHVDRGPIMWRLMNMLDAAGVEDFNIVGSPQADTE